MEKADDLKSRWHCFWTPWNQMFLWADVSGALMLLAVSCDRLNAVSFPLKYFKMKQMYGLFWVGLVFGFTAACAVVATGLVMQHERKAAYPATCSYIFGLDPTYHKFNGNVRIFGGVEWHQVNQAHNMVQRKLTKTLAICSAFTLVLYVIPLAVEQAVVSFTLIDGDNVLLSSFMSYIYIINNINPTSNFFIYILRHKEIKKAVTFMFRCKQMSIVEFKICQEVTVTNKSSHVTTKN